MTRLGQKIGANDLFGDPSIQREVNFLDALLLTHDHADAILGSGLSGLFWPWAPWESETGNLRMCSMEDLHSKG